MTKRLPIFTISCLILFTSLRGFALDSFRNWSEVTFNAFSKDQKIQVILQTHLRAIPQQHSLNQILQRNMIGYLLSPQLSFHLGYDFIPNMNPSKGTTKYEQRLAQQISYIPIDHLKNSLTIRSRLEERYLSGLSGVQLRLRERVAITMTHLLNFLPRHSTPVIYDEVFLNLNTQPWSSKGLIDQNRTFAGYWFKLGSNTILELGYIYQWVAGIKHNQNNHIFSIALRFNNSPE